MTDFFRKPLSEITVEDIQQLIDDNHVENERLDYKGQLSEEGEDADSWESGGKLSKDALKGVLKGLVAFANAFGGYLVLGVSEDPENRDHPDKITPVPRCEELATRLMQQARSLVDPIIPALRAVAVCTAADSGVVVFQVERSYLAPHRLRLGNECYMRRGTESAPMNMREIQDLTLRATGNSERLETLFSERATDFEDLIGDSRDKKAGFRVSFCPLWPLGETRVHGNDRLFPEIKGTIALCGDVKVTILSLAPRVRARPIVRGSRRSEKRQNWQVTQTLGDNGWGEIRCVFEQEATKVASVAPASILGGLYNSLRMLRAYREGIGSPSAEYVVDWEIRDGQGSVRLASWPGAMFDKTMGDAVRRGQIHFPRLTVVDPSEFDALMHLAYEDLLHAVGIPFPENDQPLKYEWQ